MLTVLIFYLKQQQQNCILKFLGQHWIHWRRKYLVFQRGWLWSRKRQCQMKTNVPWVTDLCSFHVTSLLPWWKKQSKRAKKHEAFHVVTEYFIMSFLLIKMNYKNVWICSTVYFYNSSLLNFSTTEINSNFTLTIFSSFYHRPWRERNLICTIYSKQKKTDGLRWLNSQIANYKESSGHNFHGSHWNIHFPIFNIKKLLKKIQNGIYDICVN